MLGSRRRTGIEQPHKTFRYRPPPICGVVRNRRAVAKRAAEPRPRRPRSRRKSRPESAPGVPKPRTAAAPRTAEGGTTSTGDRDQAATARAATRPQRRRYTEPPARAAGDRAATRCPGPPSAGKLAHSSGLGSYAPLPASKWHRVIVVRTHEGSRPDAARSPDRCPTPACRGDLKSRPRRADGRGGNQMAPYSRSQILGVAVHAKPVAMRADAALAEAHTSSGSTSWNLV
jgi:hypothetical protein